MRKRAKVWIVVVVLVAVTCAVWIGGGWLWQKLLAMHGVH